jgi:hypothetical protein
MTADHAFGPWRRDVDPAERLADLRALRALTFTLCGPRHPLIRALHAAETGDADTLAAALREIDALPALPRRRLLSSFAALSGPIASPEPPRRKEKP